MSEQTRIVEIEGVKIEVDMRTAKRVDNFKIGDNVKVLVKDSYSSPKVYPGVIVGFEPFEKMPTIIICYMKDEYRDADLEFVYYNSQSVENEDKYIEIIKSTDEYLPFKKGDILEKMQQEVDKHKLEIEDIERKRAYFLKYFNMYFKDTSSE